MISPPLQNFDVPEVCADQAKVYLWHPRPTAPSVHPKRTTYCKNRKWTSNVDAILNSTPCRFYTRFTWWQHYEHRKIISQYCGASSMASSAKCDNCSISISWGFLWEPTEIQVCTSLCIQIPLRKNMVWWRRFPWICVGYTNSNWWYHLKTAENQYFNACYNSNYVFQ